MAELTWFVSPTEIEIGLRSPSDAATGDAWQHVAVTFLDVALGERGVWIATLADPSDLDWTAFPAGDSGGTAPVAGRCDGRNVAFGHVERFDGRVARAIIGSGDFRWDSVFLFPRALDELADTNASLASIDVRAETFARSGEFVCSFGDGIGMRWIHPRPACDIARIERAAADRGLPLVPITASDRIR